MFRWPGLDPREWQARRVLGAGASGVVGQWDYIGNDVTKPRAMAIKQAMPRDYVAMASESKFLHLIAGTGTQHIAKLYKAAHEDSGTGTMKEAEDENADDPTNFRDPLPFDDEGNFDEQLQVNRMYLEYVSGGDLGGLLRGMKEDPTQKPPEEHLWRILQCLAKAQHVLEFGTEDPTARNKDTTWSRYWFL